MNSALSLRPGGGGGNRQNYWRHRHIHPDRHKEDYRSAGSLEDGESENNDWAGVVSLLTGGRGGSWSLVT